MRAFVRKPPFRDVRNLARLCGRRRPWLCSRASTAHVRVFCCFGLNLLCFANPQHVVAPYEDLAQ